MDTKIIIQHVTDNKTEQKESQKDAKQIKQFSVKK